MPARAAQADGNPEALEAMERALARHLRDVNESLAKLDEILEHRLVRMRGLQREAQNAVDRARDEFDAAHDDEGEALEQQYESATVRLAKITRWVNDADSRCLECRARQSNYLRDLEASVSGARRFLQVKRDRLLHTQALPLESAPDTLRVSSERPAAYPAVTRRDDGSRLPLPRGFRWISLGELDLARELGDLRPSTKGVSPERMRDGLARLLDSVLPALEQDPTRRSEFFRESDSRAGVEYAEGVQQVYDAFFGEACIYVVKGPDGRFTIVNGRHRIHAAMELGWLAVPARVRE